MTLLVVAALASMAATPGPNPSPSPDTATVLNVYTDNPDTRGVRATTVANREKVTIHVYKGPNETCDLDTKREELKEPPSAIGLALTALRSAFGTASVKTRECVPSVAKGTLETKFIAADDQTLGTGKGLLNDVANVEHQLTIARELITCQPSPDAADDAKATGPAASTFEAGTTPSTKDADEMNGSHPSQGLKKALNCKDAATYSSAIKDVIANAATALDATVSSLRGDEAVFANLQDGVKAASQENTLSGDEVTALYAGLSCIGRRIDQSKAAQARLQVAREALATFVTTARAVPVWTTQQDLLLPLDADAKVTATATCKNIFTGLATIKPVTVIVIYQDEPMFSASAGVLVSAVDRRKIGLAPVRSDGTAGFVNTFSTVDHADSQVLPFTFLTLRLANLPRKWFLGFSGGVGINGSSGSRQVEYFFGPTLGHGKFDIHLGIHSGRSVRLGGGFVLDTPAPEKLATAPVRYVPDRGLAIAVAYRLPLP